MGYLNIRENLRGKVNQPAPYWDHHQVPGRFRLETESLDGIKEAMAEKELRIIREVRSDVKIIRDYKADPRLSLQE